MKKVLKIFGLLILIFVICFLVNFYFLNINNTNKSTTDKKETVLVITKPDSLETNMMFFGDVFWGRYVNDWAMASELKEAYPFSGLSTLDRDKYQAWIGSLNCPITDKQVSSYDQDETLTFNCTPNYMPEVKKWFNIFSMANSHTDNQGGMTGFTQTREYLDENNIQYFGHYDKTVTDEICEIVEVKTKAFVGEKDYSKETGTNYSISDFNMPIAMCGYHDTFSLPTQEQLDEISKYTDKFVTIVYAIQGSEYGTTADGLQRQYFHAMIDEGADAVIGKGAHVVQDTEAYKGKPIIYSMGNFVYDQQAIPDVRHGIGVTVDITFQYSSDLEKWQSIVSDCAKFKDECLAQSKELGLIKPKYSIKYDIVATDNSDRLAKKGSDQLQSEMLVRTNWAKTLEGLSSEE